MDAKYMKLAIELAKKGAGFVSPNPLVGAVIEKDGKIIGRGYHAKYGDLHAERQALNNCKLLGHNPKNSTMYVTLEPCCHYGKQPPCTDTLIEAKLSKVVIGSSDPNPLVSGKGTIILKNAGIKVVENFLVDECDALNKVFFYFIKNKLPYIACKFAMTLDGKIATKTGASKWITCNEAREYVHKLRTKYTAIMVGSGTALSDNPLLTSHGKGRDPIRIICDTELKTPLESKIVQTASEVKTIFATCSKDTTRILSFKNKACEILVLPKLNGKINLIEMLKVLASKNIDSIFVEGGATLNYSLFSEQLVQKVYAFVAGKIFGGRDAKTPVEGEGIEKVQNAFTISNLYIQKIGNDFLLEGDL